MILIRKIAQKFMVKALKIHFYGKNLFFYSEASNATKRVPTPRKLSLVDKQ